MEKMKQWNERGFGQKGLTLVELMVALVLSFILISAIYRGFTSQHKAYTVQDQVAEAQQNARMAMNILVRDIRMAGHGMPDGGIEIGGTTYSNAIKIVKAGKYKGVEQFSDSITVVGAFGAPSGYLNRTLSAGSTELYLRSSDEAENFDSGDKGYIFIGGIDKLTVDAVSGNKIQLKENTTVRYPTAILSDGVGAGNTDIPVVDASGLVSGDVLSLGTETIIITAVSPDTVTVDTDPETAGNQGITGDYPGGTMINPIPVFRVTAVEYAIDDSDPYHPVLTREDLALGTAALLAGNIDNIEINPPDADQSSYFVRLTARTKNPDANYVENEGYRQRILQSTVTLRNL